LRSTDISADIWVLPIYRYRPQWEFTKCCYIPHASRKLAQESTMKQVKTVILQQR